MNCFGTLYRTTIFGESHGIEIGAVIDGCPAGIPLCEDDFIPDLDRRRSGTRGTTPRKESDLPAIVSGVFNGFTTGAPITVLFKNENVLSNDYKNLITHPRPGHADFVAQVKYKGFTDYRGGGHFSGRITLGVVASGVIAKKILEKENINIQASILNIGGENDKNRFSEIIEDALRNRNSIGGTIECKASGIPIGLGEPFFNSVESLISHAIFAIPAVRGIEFGDGFKAAFQKGSEHNDLIADRNGKTVTNHAGGINGGITNGNDIIFRIAVKPTSSISSPQMTFNTETQKIEELVIKGRHDACIALRVPVIVEAMTALVLADLSLIHKK
ncbi:MAG TPA: chorismate synthase [Candidatus Avirikenella pullistercoris]|nr:chorismate synthase [Candidatus Avirikenella pullistercoris]